MAKSKNEIKKNYCEYIIFTYLKLFGVNLIEFNLWKRKKIKKKKNMKSLIVII